MDNLGQNNLTERFITFDQLFITKDNVNCLDENGEAIFIIAAKEGNVEYMEELLTLGANINIQNSGGSTALIEATLSNNIQSVRFLLDRGADTAIKDDHQNTAFKYAYNRGYEEIGCMFVEYDDSSDGFPLSGFCSFTWGCC